MRTRWMMMVMVALGMLAWTAGCGDDGTDPVTASPEKKVDGGGKADAWNWRNSPDRFNIDLNYKLEELPKEGQSAKVAWPDTYWPTYENGPVARWQGKNVLSPMEKYDMAFNGWTPEDGFMDLQPWDSSHCGDGAYSKEYYDQLGPAAKHWSQNKGNARSRNGKDDDSDGEIDECDDYDGVETWWGLCHAWVPAAILEEEPLEAVTINGVTFDVSDIKALLIAMYDRSNALMLGDRCNKKDVTRDEHGRIVETECRDTNAGALHVVLSNMLGVQRRPLAEDRTYNYEVWNQPLVGFRVSLQEERTLREALDLLGLKDETKYIYNDDAKRFFEVRLQTDYITESQPSTSPRGPEISQYTRHDNYHYILELDEAGNILGGEYLDGSVPPDFLWLPLSPASVLSNPFLDATKIHDLLKASRTPAPITAEVTTVTDATATAIPDNNTTGITRKLEVTEDFVGKTVKATVKIEHTWIGDLVVTLEHEGVKAVLHDRDGGSTKNLEKTYTVDVFNGGPVGGEWTLSVQDTAGQDVGTLQSWSLELTPSE